MAANIDDIRHRWERNEWDDRHLKCHKAIGELLAALVRLQTALDGTHFHHKAWEPECSHCQAALQTRRPE